MDAVKGALGTVGSILGTAGSIFSAAGDVLSKMGSTIFILGFIGLLFTFLWFLFRYLDEKRLSLPTVIFIFFFFIFLSGNLLLIAQDADGGSSPEFQTVGAGAQVNEPSPAGETLV